MPLPSPDKKEKEQSFINRCMGSAIMVKEYDREEQRLAICYSQYRRAKKRKKAKGSSEEPLWSEQVIASEDGDCVILF